MGNSVTNSIKSAPQEVLDDLKCVACGELLTCPPVLFCQGKGNICGRCPPSDEPAERNKAFEALLSLQLLPCRYSKDCCTTEVKSSEMIEHEEKCSYRQFVCPAMSLGSCEWKGMKLYSTFKEHFASKHPSFLSGSGPMSLELKSDSITNVLVIHNKSPFLLQLNYHLQSQTLWSALLYYDNPPENQCYKYVLELISTSGIKCVFPSSSCYSALDTLRVHTSKMCETPLTQVRNIMYNTKELSYDVTISVNNQ